MNKILFVFIAISIYCLALFAAGGRAPSRVAVDGMYQIEAVDSVKNVTLFGSASAGLDTLDGADSVRCLKKWNPDPGWEYILTTNALSGAEAATANCQVFLDAKDVNDSLIVHTLLDTFAAAGGSILLPIGQEHAGVGAYFDVWIKSETASEEILIQKLWLHKRRPITVTRGY